MSAAIERLPIRASLAGRWQVPVFLVGIAVFASGLHFLSSRPRTTTFEDQLKRIHALRSVGALTRASAYTVALLQEPERPREERATLHAQLAGIIHQAEARLMRHNPRNVASILEHYRKATELQAALGPSDFVAWGDAYHWADQPADAVRAYRLAVSAGAAGKDRLRRSIVELSLGRRCTIPDELQPELEAILTDTTATPSNYLWAVEQRIEQLTRDGDLAGAMALVSQARDRLSGTEDRIAVSYSEAVCLYRSGLTNAAQDRLHALRSEWRLHDELWGRSGWLLGQIEQDDGRPQAALNYFEEVLRAFQSGDVYDRCILGRAESLAALSHYHRALDVFTELRDRLLSRDPPAAIDAEAVRRAVTSIGETLITEGRLQLGAAYMEAGLSLVDPQDAPLREMYISRRAQVLVQLARQWAQGAVPEELDADDDPDVTWAAAQLTENDSDTSEYTQRARELYVQAAEQYLMLVELSEPLEKPAVSALQAAADYFDLGGRPDRMVETLTRLVQEYPTTSACGGALLRMARVHQSQGRLDAAIRCYRHIIESYPRTPPALQSMVPLANCLLARGGDEAREGESRLIDLIEDRGPDPLFSPQAIEYREALINLAEYYVQASPDVVPDHLEKAISRLEDAIQLYPDDPQMPRLRFLLADAYRVSAGRLRTESKQLVSPLASRAGEDAADERVARALDEYDRVIALLAAVDDSKLSDLARTFLRASYLYRGDCLFDLGRYSEAMIAYHEAAWRYENLPTAIAAMLQVVHCHERLGQAQEARAALARLGWLLKKTPASTFDTEPGMSSKTYWETMVARMERTWMQ